MAQWTSAPTGVAIVSWHDDDSVRVEVGVQKRARGEWLSQELSFREQDQPEERWRATGLAIGTLVGEMRWGASGAPRAIRLGVRNGTLGRPRLRATRRALRLRSERSNHAAGSTSVRSQGPRSTTELSGRGLRARSLSTSEVFGVRRAVREPPGSPGRRRGRRCQLDHGGCRRWLRFAGIRSALGLDVRLEATWQYVRVSARDPISGDSGSAASSLFGARAGGDASWTLARPIALVIGAELSALNAPVDVRLRDQRIGTASRMQYALLGGARFWLR
jgi:hypothetical protein